MTTQRDDEAPAAFASPPCLLHEVDPAYSGLPATAGLQAWADIQRWREAERARLLAARLALPPAIRRAKDVAIAANLEAILGDVAGRVWDLLKPLGVAGAPPVPSLAVSDDEALCDG